MSITEMENRILSFLYNCWQTGTHNSVGNLYNQIGISDKELLERAVDELERNGFIKDWGECLHTKILASGIKEAERRGLVAPEKIKKY